MQLCWEVMAVIVLSLACLNIIAQNYYLHMVKERRAKSIPQTLLKISIPIVLYATAAFCSCYFYPYFRKTIPFEVGSPSDFDVSSSTMALEAKPKRTLPTMQTSLEVFHGVLVPFVFLCRLGFAIFGGVGLALFPINMVFKYLHRPRQPDPEEHVLSKKVLRDTTEGLLSKGKEIHELQRDIQINTTDDERVIRNKKRIMKERLYELKRDLIEFEEIYEHYTKEDNIIESNPLEYYGYLILGITTGFISVLIIAHAIMTVAGIYGVLEWLFLKIAQFNNILAMSLFFLMTLYLCVIVVYGSAQSIYLLSWALNSHPVKAAGTWTDSFLILINIGLFGTMGGIFFMIEYCRQYLRFLDVDTLFIKVLSRSPLTHKLKKSLVFGYIMMLCFLITFFAASFLMTSKMNMADKVKEQRRVYNADKEKLQAFEQKDQQTLA